MKQFTIIFLLGLILTGCNDGDVILTSFDFENATLESCNNNSTYVFFKINTASNETISAKLEVSESTLIESNTNNIILNGTTNYVNYRLFNGDVTPSYFCNEVPPISPVVSKEYIASSGIASIVTITVNDDNDGLSQELEGDEDTDGDLLPNYFDFDDDGDNVPTSLEIDTENIDQDNNPLTNPKDTDGDSIPDYLDPDDDGDGVLTRYEAGGDLDPTDNITDASIGPDYLNPSVKNEVIINQYREHNYNFDSGIELILIDVVLIHAEETIIKETVNMGTIDSFFTGNITITPVFQ